MNEFDLLFLEDEEILLEKDDELDIDIPEEEEDNTEGEQEEDTPEVDETEENSENTEDDTKQNNNDENIEGNESEEDVPETDDSMEGEELEEEPEEEDTMTKNRRLSFYNNFEDLYNITLSFLDKLDSIKDSIVEEERKNTLIELEKRLIKQKKDINFLLKKKIKSINEENLNKLLIVFTTKTDTIIDITKSVIKETK